MLVIGRSRGVPKRMKFRAIVKDCKTFATVCNAIKSFLKNAVLKLHKTKMRLVACPSGGAASDGAQVWCSFPTAGVLTDVRLEVKTNDAIHLEIPDLGQLVFALRECAKSAAPVIMKLTGGTGARQLVQLATTTGGSDLVYEVPVRVVSDGEMASLIMPAIESGVVNVELPSLDVVMAFADRMRGLGATQLTVQLTPNPDALRAGGGGDDGAAAGDVPTVGLTLTAKAPDMESEIEYKAVPLIASVAGDDDGPPTRPVVVSVDLRKFGRCCLVQQLTPTRIWAHLVHERVFVLSAFAGGDTNFVFYLPAITVAY